MLIEGTLSGASDLAGFQCLPLRITAYSISFVFDVGTTQRAGKRLCIYEFQPVAILSVNAW